MSAHEAIKLLREVGVHRIGGMDGCSCCEFKIQNIEISVSCGKGMERGIRIFSPSLDYYPDSSELLPVAEEVRRQVEKNDGRGQCPIKLLTEEEYRKRYGWDN